MKKWILLAVFFDLIGNGYAQYRVPKDKFIALLNEGRWDSVYYQCIRMRGEVFGKSALLDYFIAKCLCLDGKRDDAISEYYKIRKNYSLSPQQKKFLANELSYCGQVTGAAASDLLTSSHFNYLNNVNLPVAGVGGKMGYVYNCYYGARYSHFDSLMTAGELESRIFGLHEKKKAFEKLTRLLGKDYTVDSGGRFMVVSQKSFNLDDEQVKTAVTSLERVFNFYISYYGLRFPDKLITVYLMPNTGELLKLARRIHYLDLPGSQLGYSCPADLSLVGIADAGHIATLYHELFHIVVRTDVGDIPAWLDEGLACLYTISHWQGNILVGDKRPWRWSELEKAARNEDYAMQVPTLHRLLDYNWDEFNGVDDSVFNLCKAATNYAYSNFLMIYLQEKNDLQRLVKVFKHRPSRVGDSITGSGNSVLIVEMVLKEDIDSINRNYDQWLDMQEHIRIRRSDQPTLRTTPTYQEKLEVCLVLRYTLQENRHLDADQAGRMGRRLDSLENMYRSARPLYDAMQKEVYGLQKNTNSTLISLPPGAEPDLAKAVGLYNELTRLEIEIRKLLFYKNEQAR